MTLTLISFLGCLGFLIWTLTPTYRRLVTGWRWVLTVGWIVFCVAVALHCLLIKLGVF